MRALWCCVVLCGAGRAGRAGGAEFKGHQPCFHSLLVEEGQ